MLIVGVFYCCFQIRQVELDELSVSSYMIIIWFLVVEKNSPGFAVVEVRKFTNCKDFLSGVHSDKSRLMTPSGKAHKNPGGINGMRWK